MFKKHIIRLVVAIALFVAVMGGSGIVADSLGLAFTPQAYACNGSGSGGGGC